jgi:hypothetical protein|mmetsp:Transcript_78104/g.123259  ORF Transcript_78104/g.123259 Transcript_78104/m.123259 type:complete len:85 (-) Transcript_78104:1609-1863(-)
MCTPAPKRNIFLKEYIAGRTMPRAQVTSLVFNLAYLMHQAEGKKNANSRTCMIEHNDVQSLKRRAPIVGTPCEFTVRAEGNKKI